MNDMVERLARLFAERGLNGCEVTDGGGSIAACVGPCDCRDFARAAIAAMRAPTVTMINAGYITLDGEKFERPREPMNAWPLMIDAALA